MALATNAPPSRVCQLPYSRRLDFLPLETREQLIAQQWSNQDQLLPSCRGELLRDSLSRKLAVIAAGCRRGAFSHRFRLLHAELEFQTLAANAIDIRVMNHPVGGVGVPREIKCSIWFGKSPRRSAKRVARNISKTDLWGSLDGLRDANLNLAENRRSGVGVMEFIVVWGAESLAGRWLRREYFPGEKRSSQSGDSEYRRKWNTNRSASRGQEEALAESQTHPANRRMTGWRNL